MEYINEIAWLSLWPIVIYVSYKLVIRNIINFEQKEEYYE